MLKLPSDVICLGLTGGPGVGKSTVRNKLATLSFYAISADEIGHQILNSNKQVNAQLRALLGKEIFDGNGDLSRKIISLKVLSNPKLLKKYNKIIWPVLLRELKKKIRTAIREGIKFIVVDAALIYEWGIEDWFTNIITVTSKKSVYTERLKMRGWSVSKINKIVKAQIKLSEKAKRADFVISNNGSLAALMAKVNVLTELILIFKV